MTIDPVCENDSDTEEVEAEAVEAPGAASEAPARSQSRRVLIPVLALLAASIVGAAWLYFSQYRGEEATGPVAAESVRRAATEGTVALLSYTPTDLDRDLAAAKTHLTGDFLTYYSKFSDEIVAPAAKEKAVETHASVVRSAVAELHPDAAKVLVFLNQTTTSKSTPAPAQSASSVMVSLTKVEGRWLISAFDPM